MPVYMNEIPREVDVQREIDMDEEGETQEEEGRVMKGKKNIEAPSKEEYEEHMRTHIPYRSWCPFCVKGKMKANPHKTKSKEKEHKEVPMLHWDYMEQKSKDGKYEESDMTNKTLAGLDEEVKWHMAYVVPHKGENDYAIGAVSEEVKKCGYNRMIFKSDQEPSLKKLLEAAKRERAENIEIMTEHSPVGESKSN